MGAAVAAAMGAAAGRTGICAAHLRCHGVLAVSGVDGAGLACYHLFLGCNGVRVGVFLPRWYALRYVPNLHTTGSPRGQGALQAVAALLQQPSGLLACAAHRVKGGFAAQGI